MYFFFTNLDMVLKYLPGIICWSLGFSLQTAGNFQPACTLSGTSRELVFHLYYVITYLILKKLKLAPRKTDEKKTFYSGGRLPTNHIVKIHGGVLTI